VRDAYHLPSDPKTGPLPEGRSAPLSMTASGRPCSINPASLILRFRPQKGPAEIHHGRAVAGQEHTQGARRLVECRPLLRSRPMALGLSRTLTISGFFIQLSDDRSGRDTSRIQSLHENRPARGKKLMTDPADASRETIFDN